MKKTVQFKKELEFNTDISEITSISLEHNLKNGEGNLISGEFLIIGDYKITDVSVNTENFEFALPFDISVDDKYEISNVVIDINDFYYELVNNEKLLVDIEVSLDNLEEIVEIETLPEEPKIEEIPEEREVTPIKEYVKEITKLNEEEVIPVIEETKEKEAVYVKEEKIKEEVEIKDKKIEEVKGYITYKVYIMKEEDTVESIIHKYGIEKDVLEQYNNLSNITVGDKLIIPKND